MSGKVIVAEIVAEVLIPFVRTFAVLLLLHPASISYLTAATALGLLIYATATVFGIELNLNGDPLVSLQLLFIKWFDNKDRENKLTTRSIVLSIVKIAIDVVMAMLAGLSYRWLAGASLPVASQLINQFPGNGGWATYILLGIVVTVAYHVIVFTNVYSADGYGASLATGITYFIVSIVSSRMIHGFLDVGVNIGIAFAIFPAAQSGEWWWMLATFGGAAVLTVLLYYLLWNTWFDADTRREKKERRQDGLHRNLFQFRRCFSI